MEKTYLRAIRPVLWLFSAIAAFGAIYGYLAPALVSSTDSGLALLGLFTASLGFLFPGWLIIRAFKSFQLVFNKA